MKKIIVYIPGKWDLLHSGHIKAIERASKYGDVLIVAVQSDEDAFNDNGNYPAISQEDRILALEAIKYVDIAVPYKKGDYLKNVVDYCVDVLVLCDKYKDVERFQSAVDYMLSNNKMVVYLPYSDKISSTEIKETIRCMA